MELGWAKGSQQTAVSFQSRERKAAGGRWAQNVALAAGTGTRVTAAWWLPVPEPLLLSLCSGGTGDPFALVC